MAFHWIYFIALAQEPLLEGKRNVSFVRELDACGKTWEHSRVFSCPAGSAFSSVLNVPQQWYWSMWVSCSTDQNPNMSETKKCILSKIFWSCKDVIHKNYVISNWLYLNLAWCFLIQNICRSVIEESNFGNALLLYTSFFFQRYAKNKINGTIIQLI